MGKRQLSVEMDRKEILRGLCFLPFYLILLSLGLEMLFRYVLRRDASGVELNICYYAINILAVLLIFHGFLVRSLKHAPWKRCFIAAGIALVAYFVLSVQMSALIYSLHPEFANQNNNTIVDMQKLSPVFVLIMAVVLAPIVEETLFRGLIFGNLLRVNAVAAYVITILGFSAIHVVGYLNVLTPLEILLSILQYVPASLVLCVCYQMTDSIMTPMIMHSTVNLIACAVLQISNAL